MIIRKIKIDLFAGISDFEIDLDDGINIVYGDNEKGKTTIENFIKIMLYGFTNKKINGEKERSLFIPFDGGTIGGELVIEHNNKLYLLNRKFATTKKQDKSIILDTLTGKEVDYIDKDEPGRYFLGINRSTFEKTLFVGQLGVVFSEDREEEIIDRITSTLGCGTDEVQVNKALDTLENLKKNIKTVRGVGELDILKKREQELVEELYEAHKIAEKNINWEEELYAQKELKKRILDTLDKLEIYKNYLRQLGLKEEYEELKEYLVKTEDLKNQQEEIKSLLFNGDNIIDEEYIASVEEERRRYLEVSKDILNLRDEFDNIAQKRSMLEEELLNYKFIDEFGVEIKEKILELKYEQKELNNKLYEINEIEKDIARLQSNINESYQQISDSQKDHIMSVFKLYEEELLSIKALMEGDNRNNNFYTVIDLIILLIGIGASIFLSVPFKILGIICIIISIIVFIIVYNNKNISRKTIRLKKSINRIEEELNRYLKEFNMKNYADLLRYINIQDKKKEENIKNKIILKDKQEQLQNIKPDIIKNRYEANRTIVDKIIRSSNSRDIEDVINKTYAYEKIKNELVILISSYDNKKHILDSKEKEIDIIKCNLDNKLSKINLKGVEVSEIKKYLDDYINKINRYKEIQTRLTSMKETYNVLLKDRDIKDIEKQIKKIINYNIDFNYKNEEEVEKEQKNKNNELLECEKNIKDLENNIANRLIGKREIPEISEELEEVRDEIKQKENKLKAIEIAIKYMNESVEEVRSQVIPTLNEKITENFRNITEDRYKEVILGDNYEMLVRNNSDLFKGKYLSNGALDQLYLSLRIALIQLIFEGEDEMIILDDAFVQYDDNRCKRALEAIVGLINGQIIIFTCHKREEKFLSLDEINFNRKYL